MFHVPCDRDLSFSLFCSAMAAAVQVWADRSTLAASAVGSVAEAVLVKVVVVSFTVVDFHAFDARLVGHPTNAPSSELCGKEQRIHK